MSLQEISKTGVIVAMMGANLGFVGFMALAVGAVAKITAFDPFKPTLGRTYNRTALECYRIGILSLAGGAALVAGVYAIAGDQLPSRADWSQIMHAKRLGL